MRFCFIEEVHREKLFFCFWSPDLKVFLVIGAVTSHVSVPENVFYLHNVLLVAGSHACPELQLLAHFLLVQDFIVTPEKKNKKFTNLPKNIAHSLNFIPPVLGLGDLFAVVAHRVTGTFTCHN